MITIECSDGVVDNIKVIVNETGQDLVKLVDIKKIVIDPIVPGIEFIKATIHIEAALNINLQDVQGIIDIKKDEEELPNVPTPPEPAGKEES